MASKVVKCEVHVHEWQRAQQEGLDPSKYGTLHLEADCSRHPNFSPVTVVPTELWERLVAGLQEIAGQSPNMRTCIDPQDWETLGEIANLSVDTAYALLAELEGDHE
jgi:hypothetical protein